MVTLPTVGQSWLIRTILTEGPEEEAFVAETEDDIYLRSSEVASLLHVSPKTVSRWAKEGKLPYRRTLGGHRRFPADGIRALAGTLDPERSGGA
jgi:excisionase family DNA binding protein